MADWNAKIGKEKERGITGKYGLGNRNEIVEILTEICN